MEALGQTRALGSGEALLELGKPGSLLLVDVVQHRPLDMLQLLAPFLAHRIQPFEQAELDLGHGLLLMGHGGMGLAAVIGEGRVKHAILGIGVAGEENLQGLERGLPAVRVGRGQGAAEVLFDLAMMVEGHGQPIAVSGDRLGDAAGVVAVLRGFGGG